MLATYERHKACVNRIHGSFNFIRWSDEVLNTKQRTEAWESSLRLHHSAAPCQVTEDDLMR